MCPAIRAGVGMQTSLLRTGGWLLAAVAVVAALGQTIWLSHRTSEREAAIFASLSATAFAQGFCDRAVRLAIAGLPANKGASPLSFRSPVLQGDLSLFAS